MRDMKTATTAKSTDTPRLDAQLCFALYSAGLAMNKVYRKHLKALDLTYPQYLVMLVLWEKDGLSVSEIGARLFLDSATLTPLLKRLDAANLLVRSRSRDDEREVEVTLTPRGRQLQAKASAVQHAIFCATACSANELKQLRDELRQLRGRLALAE